MNLNTLQQNKYIDYLKQNKLIVLPIVFLILLLIIVTAMVFFITENINKEKGALTPTPIPTQELQPTTTPETEQPLDPKIESMKSEVKPQIDTRVEVPYDISKAKIYEEDTWAIVEITNPTTDPANVILKKENGKWKVVLGPGTLFDETDLQAIGAPQAVINEANGSLETTTTLKEPHE